MPCQPPPSSASWVSGTPAAAPATIKTNTPTISGVIFAQGVKVHFSLSAARRSPRVDRLSRRYCHRIFVHRENDTHTNKTALASKRASEEFCRARGVGSFVCCARRAAGVWCSQALFSSHLSRLLCLRGWPAMNGLDY